MTEFFTRLLGLPPLSSVHGARVDDLLIYLHYLMGALFVGWTLYFIYTLWRFRQTRHPRADHVGATTHASTWIEGGVAAVEIGLLLLLAVPQWTRAVEKFPAEKDSTVLRVIGRQFNWMARYPGADGVFGRQDLKLLAADNPLGVDKTDPASKDDIETSEMAVPVNKPVILQVSALDVIHSFKIPAMRMTQDAIPGMRIPVHFKPTQTNTYQINCAQLCGNGHSNMKGIFRVLTAEQYAEWLKSKAGGTTSYE